MQRFCTGPPTAAFPDVGTGRAYPLSVGTDPRRLDGLSADETVAALLVERATGGVATAHDVQGRQGAYDVLLTHPDGRRAALEVTTHAAPGIRRHGVLLGRTRHAWPNPGRRAWGIVLASPHDLPRLRAVYSRAITTCEALGVDTPASLPLHVLDGDPELRWLATQSASSLVTLAARQGRAPSTVTVTPRPPTGAVDSRLEALPDAVSRLLLVPHVAHRVAKVARAPGVEERHLLVGIGEGGVPDAVYRALCGPVAALPPADPEVEEPRLSHLWLTTDWGGSPLVCWDRVRGWTAHAAT